MIKGIFLKGYWVLWNVQVGFLQGAVGGFVGAPELPTTTTTSTVSLELFVGGSYPKRLSRV